MVANGFIAEKNETDSNYFCLEITRLYFYRKSSKIIYTVVLKDDGTYGVASYMRQNT